jgi:hypothetical protein
VTSIVALASQTGPAPIDTALISGVVGGVVALLCIVGVVVALLIVRAREPSVQQQALQVESEVPASMGNYDRVPQLLPENPSVVYSQLPSETKSNFYEEATTAMSR